LVHRNSFPELSNFPQYFAQLCKFPGGATFEKHADPEKKNRTRRKSRAKKERKKQSESARTFSKIEKRREFVRALSINNAQRSLSKGSTLLRGCWVWSKKLRFQKNFDENFNAVETSNRKNWRLERIGDSGTKPVISKYCLCMTYCMHLATAEEITQQE